MPPKVMSRLSNQVQVCFVAFDLLFLDGSDVRPVLLCERKALLRQVAHEARGV